MDIYPRFSICFPQTSHIKPSSRRDKVQGEVIEILEDGTTGIPRKYFYPLLATALLLFVIACVIVSTVVYKCAQSKDYTLIKKAPSNIYIDVDCPPEKKIEVRSLGFCIFSEITMVCWKSYQCLNNKIQFLLTFNIVF